MRFVYDLLRIVLPGCELPDVEFAVPGLGAFQHGLPCAVQEVQTPAVENSGAQNQMARQVAVRKMINQHVDVQDDRAHVALRVTPFPVATWVLSSAPALLL